MNVDLFITTKGRQDLLIRSLQSLHSCTDSNLFRLTLIDDGGDEDSRKTYDAIIKNKDSIPRISHFIMHETNLGLGPSINQALAHIETLNQYYSDARAHDVSQISDFICYCQDDLLYSRNWLQRLMTFFMLNEKKYNLGFASGVECIEHKVKKDIGGGIILKDWIRAAQMFARREYWMSMFPIPRFDPETGRIRAKPNDGMGSGVDWHFIRNHNNSVCKSGKTCLVIPGLIKHIGYKESTWLNRELPESDSDKAAM